MKMKKYIITLAQYRARRIGAILSVMFLVRKSDSVRLIHKIILIKTVTPKFFHAIF